MKVFRYDLPEKLKDHEGVELDNPFSGYLELEIPTYKERLQLVKEMNFDTDKPEIEDGLKMLDLVEKRVRTVKAKFKDEPVTDLDTIGYYKEGAIIINTLGQHILGGFVSNP